MQGALSTATPSSLTVAEAARRIGVSTSTIRNWLHAGELDESEPGRVTLRSVERCEREQVGRRRLISRANKRHKPSETRAVAKGDVSRYDETLSESHRNSHGVYYTPQSVARDMLRGAVAASASGANIEDMLLLDPCCGSGNFLVEAIEMGFSPKNVYGYDIDPEAVKIARRRVVAYGGGVGRNVVCGDFLELAGEVRRRFDFVVTNPPWGKKMMAEERRALTRRFGVEQSSDSSSIFLVAGMRVLRRGGVLSYLLQEAFFSVRSYESVRRYLFDYKIDRLVDYGRVFRSLLTSAASITLTNGQFSHGDKILCESDSGRYFRDRSSFACNPRLILNMWSSPEAAAVIEQIFSRPHVTLAGAARWGLGVVTGDNKRHLMNEIGPGLREVVRGVDILPENDAKWGRGRVAESGVYIDDNIAKYQQFAPRELYETAPKLIYKFISKRLSFALDNRGVFTLNSANILIPDDSLKIPIEELAKLLNSDLMSWLFHQIFHTHKVLRGDLEALPIFADYFLIHPEFDENSYRLWLNVEIRE